MSPEEQRFFKTLSTRIAELRKAQNFTQQQLAELLGLSQQMIASSEVGRRWVPISMLPALATALAVSIDMLLRTAPHARRIDTVELAPRYDVRSRETRVRAWSDAMGLLRFARGARGRSVRARSA